MARLIIRPTALRHNLVVMEERCRRAGATCMFVFKEAPLHAGLTASLLDGSPVHRLGLVSWPHHALPELSGITLHHVYSPFPLLLQQSAACRSVCVGSLFSLRTLKQACGNHVPDIRLCLEVGDGRDGVLPDELPRLCEEARRLHLPLRGLSVNFACLSHEAPTGERLRFAEKQLERIRSFCLPDADISAGGTDVLELAEQESLPPVVGELRCGTGIMLGVYPLSGRPIPGTRQDTFRLEAQVLECRVKKGRLMTLLDAGSFHTAPEALLPPLSGMRFAGASSAYTVFDMTDCPTPPKEGDLLSFALDYHSLSRALISQALPITLEKA